MCREIFSAGARVVEKPVGGALNVCYGMGSFAGGGGGSYATTPAQQLPC